MDTDFLFKSSFACNRTNKEQINLLKEEEEEKKRQLVSELAHLLEEHRQSELSMTYHDWYRP